MDRYVGSGVQRLTLDTQMDGIISGRGWTCMDGCGE